MNKIGISFLLLLGACQRGENNQFTLKNPPSGQAACYEVGLEYCLKIVECEPSIKDDDGNELGKNDVTECFSVVGKVCAMSGLELKRDELVRVYDECLPALRNSDCSNYESEGEKHCPDVETEQ
jgi:hypothetical protein